MSQRFYTIRGTRGETRSATASSPASSYRLYPGSARDGASDEIEVPGNAVVRVELDNGFVLWSRVDDLTREYGTPPATARFFRRKRGEGESGGSAGAWEFSRITPQRASGGERGLVGLAIRVLDFFGTDVGEAVVDKAASKLGVVFEEKQLGVHPPGLYRVDLESAFKLQAVPADEVIPADQGPILIFLHGTASSTEGSFGKLWEASNGEGARLRQALAPTYGKRALALEHRTISESPIANALELVKRLDDGAELHLVSHSRGGLVGEVLALSGCEKLAEILTDDKLEKLFAADRTLAPQLKLSPLAKDQAAARDKAYADDRRRLGELVKLLAKKKLRVSRFVRVACPARGTTLASGRLDRWLSVLNYLVKATTGNGLFADGLDFLLAVVKERTDPRTMPGLEAMMPGSALTRLLNATPELVSSADLSVIAGDIEAGDSLWNTLKVLASDWFYQHEHDLVVDTGSMSGGLPRPANGARVREDQGAKVNHFRYFTNEQSIRWLKAGLTRADGDNAGFQPVVQPATTGARCQAAVARSRSRSNEKPQPIVVVLPGTMGSQLKAEDDRIWLEYWALLKGGLKRLAMDKEGIVPVGLVDQFYGPLVEFLAKTHQVEIFPYDWRHSVRKAAARLVETLEPLVAKAEKDKMPLRLVAHSMGGLVVRAMIADGEAGSALWKRIIRLPDSRLLMLGTPNLGSYEAVRWLTGFNPTQGKLALLDITQSTDQIIGLVGRYPGLLELLPFAPEDPDFADVSRWEKLRDAMGAAWKTAEPAGLEEAAATWKLLRAAPPDPRYMTYVAGCQPATVINYELAEGEDWWHPERKRLDFIATREGDGTVSWQSGFLPGVPVWYAEDTAHDALCAQPRAFPGYHDIMVNGQTRLLPSTPPTRSREAGQPEFFVLPALPPADSIPAEADIGSFGFSGSGPCLEESETRPVPSIEIAVRHGNLAYARHPVVVGHYQGDTVVSAEAVLDKQLGGALTRRLDLGIYPGRLGSNTIFLHDSPSAKPGGAVVVGLGRVGELSPGLLEESMRSALLDFALNVAHWPDKRFGDEGRPRSAAVSCLLIGTGAGGLPVGDALEAILRAAVAANRRLAEQELDSRVLIDRLEFLELYEDVAIAAADALSRVLQSDNLAGAVRWSAGAVEAGQAGRRRVRFEQPAEWYQRLEIKEDAGRLRFVFPTDRARAEEILATGQLSLADSFVQMASRSTGQNSEAAKTLFEMLLPLRLRELAPQQGNLLIMVDKQSARYPWELLENRWANQEEPPAVAAGCIRQFRTAEFRQQPVHGFGNTALVVGNPDLGDNTDFADLPGAQREAEQVVELLGNAAYEVTQSIRETATPIMEALHKDSWRILHLAGHGVHRYGPEGNRDKPISGMVIGAGSFLTPGDIAQMRYVPELVFINCCHLGRVDGKPDDLDRLGMAANLGEEFIRMGVRAVIAAGWAVDDHAGQVFATTFYQGMLAGVAFGEAVRAAREELWQRCREVNTWGAYQCYGDPDFRFLRSDSAPRNAAPNFGTPHELVAELENLAADLRITGGVDGSERIARRLVRIPTPQAAKWLERGDVCSALGLTWGEAGNWAEAIGYLKKGLNAEKGECSMRAIEQCANYIIRLAADTWLKARRLPVAKREQVRSEQIEIIETAILDLDTLCRRAPTTERLNLLGGAYKRLALVEAEGKGRLEALVNMAHHYRLSLERKRDAYPFTNAVAADLLASQRDARKNLPAPDKLAQEIAALSDEVARRNADDPNFWDGASLADLALLRLLVPGANLPRPSAQAADSPLAVVLGAYREAIQRASSPREKSSLSENIAFLHAIWLPRDKKMLHTLEQIQESLQ